MTTDQNPNITRLDSLQSEYDTLQRDISFDELLNEVSEVTRKVATLPDDITRARGRGYAFAAYLERKAELLDKRWDEMRQQVQRTIQSENYRTRAAFDDVRERMQKANIYRAKPTGLDSLLPEIEREINVLRGQVDTVQSRLQNEYSTLKTDIDQTVAQLHNIHWVLDQMDEASFKLNAGEAVFLAAQAEHQATGRGKDDPDGILYLTDHRLIFEQKETTGKTLGLFGGKKVQELEWEIPLNKIDSVIPENKGFLGGKDILQFTFKPGAALSQAQIEVKGGVQAKFWATEIDRMLTSGATDERAVQADAETRESIRNAPTACPICGATLPQLVANQNQIECEYCGSVIRI